MSISLKCDNINITAFLCGEQWWKKMEMHKSNLYSNMLTVSIVLREEKVVTWQRIQRKLKN